MCKKRVFILGAGFSKQAGMPLATELTSLLLSTDQTIAELKGMQEWVASLRERVAQAAGEDAAGFALNVEQLFEYAKFDEEIWRMKQQECGVGRGWGETPWRRGQTIGIWLEYLEEQLVHAIWGAQERADLGPIARFGAHLTERDTAISFNYDTLLETCLTAHGQGWNHGLEDSASGGVAVLKMHGSVDWLLLERGPTKTLDNFIRLFSKQDTNVDEHGSSPPMEEDEYASELWRAKDIQTCRAAVELDASEISNFWHRPGLAGLGSHKRQSSYAIQRDIRLFPGRRCLLCRPWGAMHVTESARYVNSLREAFGHR